MKSLEYLQEIRKAEGLSRAILKGITVEGGAAVFHLITDTNYSEKDVAYASRVSERYASGMAATAHVIKSVPSEEGVRRAAAEILRSRFPALAAFVPAENISVALDASGGRFYIDAETTQCAQDAELAVDAISSALARSFCGNWSGEFRCRDIPRGEIEHEAIPAEEPVFAPRFFPIVNYAPIDGADPKRAIYIADLTKEGSGLTVCGTITYIEERETKNGKPFFPISLTDGTGSLRASYFSKKATLEKVRGLKQGMSVCLSGDCELFNGALSLRVKSVDLGSPPPDFVPEERPSRPVPVRYTCVFPAPVSDPVQADLFGAAPLPEEFRRETFVVFDLETTGLNNMGSVIDRIIEIGAVKITGGAITEKFSTFVACPQRLPPEIVDLTGITDEMLVGAPRIRDAIADFYKFSAGAVLVGHNVSFDYRFVRHYGEKEGYIFGQKQIDTVSFAQEMLRLSNYKLNTVAEHFGFVFHHHRAFDDAFVTAKIFMELVRMKGALPKQ